MNVIRNTAIRGSLTPIEKNSNLLTIQEVAAILRVESSTVRRWVKQGLLEAIGLPHVNERQVYRIKRETVEQLLQSSQPTVSIDCS